MEHIYAVRVASKHMTISLKNKSTPARCSFVHTDRMRHADLVREMERKHVLLAQ